MFLLDTQICRAKLASDRDARETIERDSEREDRRCAGNHAIEWQLDAGGLLNAIGGEGRSLGDARPSVGLRRPPPRIRETAADVWRNTVAKRVEGLSQIQPRLERLFPEAPGW